MSRLCFYELEEVGLSYLKLIGDVKKNIINIIIIIIEKITLKNQWLSSSFNWPWGEICHVW
jgi:hypothetical protein